MAVDVIEKAIYSVLANDANVGGLVGVKIFPVRVPQGTAMPAITYEQLTGPREHTMDGPFGMAAPTWAITSWASSYGGARALADYVRLALDGYDSTVGTVKVYVGMLENEVDVSEGSADISATYRWGKRQTYVIWHEEATA